MQCIDQGDAHLQANLYEAVTNYDDGETDALVAELLSSPNERIRASGVKAAFRRELAANKMAAVNIWYKLLAGHRDMQCAALDLIPLMEQYHGLDRDHMVEMYQKCMIDLLSDADEKRKCHIYGLLVNSSKDSRFTASALEALLCLKSKNLVTLLSSLVAGDYELAVRAGAGRVFANVADVYKWCMAQEDRWLRVCGIQAYQTMEE